LASTATLSSRELGPETFIPYIRHVDEVTLALGSRTLMVMLALEGVSVDFREELTRDFH
jgi:type IV secretion system protein VirB4